MIANIDKAAAIAILIAARFPLLDVRTQTIAAGLDYGMKSPPTRRAALELIKLEPDHFADLILLKTRNFIVAGEVVFTTPDDREFHDVDVDIVHRYLVAAEYVRNRLKEMKHDQFLVRLSPVLYTFMEKEKETVSLEDEQCFFSMLQATCTQSCMAKWKVFDAWTIDEAVALSLGKDPDIVYYQTVCEATIGRRSLFRQDFEDLQRRLRRAVDAKQLPEVFSPLSFCIWAQGRSFIDEASELSRYVEEISLAHLVEGGGRLSFERKEDTRNRKKIFSLIIVMALDKYGHKLTGRSKASSAISQACNDFELNISAETISDTLRSIVDDAAMTDAMENIRKALLEIDRY